MHSTPEMQNLMRNPHHRAQNPKARRYTCTYDGCLKWPSFGFPTKGARRCGPHREPGMENVRNAKRKRAPAATPDAPAPKRARPGAPPPSPPAPPAGFAMFSEDVVPLGELMRP